MGRSSANLTVRDILQGKAKGAFKGFQRKAILLGLAGALAAHVVSLFFYDSLMKAIFVLVGLASMGLGLAAAMIYNRIKCGTFLPNKTRK